MASLAKGIWPTISAAISAACATRNHIVIAVKRLGHIRVLYPSRTARPRVTDLTLVVRHDLCSTRLAHRNGPVNCKEKHRLLEEYDVAAQRLSQTVERYGGVIGTPGVERDQVKRIADEARRETMAALQTHRLLHGC